MDRQELNDRLIALGASPRQVRAKILDMALDVLGGQDDEARDILEEKIAYINVKYDEAKIVAEGTKKTLEHLHEEQERIRQYEKELEQKREQFKRELSQLETAEARDKLRLAMLFFNIRRDYSYVGDDVLKTIGDILK